MKKSFSLSSQNEIEDKIKDLNCEKPTTLNTIPAKMLRDTEITPSHKKDDRTKKDNYRPVSFLPSVSKIIDKNMYEDINKFMNDKLSPYLCGFRKGYNSQYCLMVMLEK